MIKESDLDEDQIKALTATLDKSCIVAGCAGSGKSVLALIKAQRIQKERGNDYIIIVFTKALCQYMNSGRSELGLRNQFQHYWYWKNQLNCKPADYIIVDEIQDFTETEIQEFINAAQKNFFFYGDTAQSIYDGLNSKKTVPVEEIGYMLPKGNFPKYWELYKNYRLPVPVAKLVQYVGVDLPPFDESIYKSKETAIPYILKYEDKKSQIAAISDIIKTKDLTDIAILLPENDFVLNVSHILDELGINNEIHYNNRYDFRSSKDNLNFSSNNPKVMTYHSAKGLQFEAVFIPFIENFRDDNGSYRKALYVAMTRTYKYLYVMGTGVFPALISNIPQELYKTSTIEQIDDI